MKVGTQSQRGAPLMLVYDFEHISAFFIRPAVKNDPIPIKSKAI
jgi:hypothetical protein